MYSWACKRIYKNEFLGTISLETTSSSGPEQPLCSQRLRALGSIISRLFHDTAREDHHVFCGDDFRYDGEFHCWVSGAMGSGGAGSPSSGSPVPSLPLGR